MLLRKHPNRKAYRPPTPVAKANEELQLLSRKITGRDMEAAIMAYLRERRGKLVPIWDIARAVCVSRRPLIRLEERFFRRQLTRLINEKKVIRYYRMHANKVRISEAWV